jgi:hypothetical protein
MKKNIVVNFYFYCHFREKLEACECYAVGRQHVADENCHLELIQIIYSLFYFRLQECGAGRLMIYKQSQKDRNRNINISVNFESH